MSHEFPRRFRKPAGITIAALFLLNACSSEKHDITPRTSVPITAEATTSSSPVDGLDIVASDNDQNIVVAYHGENGGSISFDFVSPKNQQIIELARYVCQGRLIHVVPGIETPGGVDSSLPGQYMAVVDEAKINALKPDVCEDGVMSRPDAVEIAA